MKLNKKDIRSYLSFLSPSPLEIFTYCLLDKKSEGVIPGCGVLFGTVDEVLEVVSASPDATLHVVLNRTSLSGRKTRDIEGVRVLCVDIDTPWEEDTVIDVISNNRVQLAVESSPGKYHLYWAAWPGLGLEKWKELQLGLAGRYGGDLGLAQAAKTIRAPGVPRVCKDGQEFLPRIVYDERK